MELVCSCNDISQERRLSSGVRALILMADSNGRSIRQLEPNFSRLNSHSNPSPNAIPLPMTSDLCLPRLTDKNANENVNPYSKNRESKLPSFGIETEPQARRSLFHHALLTTREEHASEMESNGITADKRDTRPM